MASVSYIVVPVLFTRVRWYQRNVWLHCGGGLFVRLLNCLWDYLELFPNCHWSSYSSMGSVGGNANPWRAVSNLEVSSKPKDFLQGWLKSKCLGFIVRAWSEGAAPSDTDVCAHRSGRWIPKQSFKNLHSGRIPLSVKYFASLYEHSDAL